MSGRPAARRPGTSPAAENWKVTTSSPGTNTLGSGETRSSSGGASLLEERELELLVASRSSRPRPACRARTSRRRRSRACRTARVPPFCSAIRCKAIRCRLTPLTVTSRASLVPRRVLSGAAYAGVPATVTALTAATARATTPVRRSDVAWKTHVLPLRDRTATGPTSRHPDMPPQAPKEHLTASVDNRDPRATGWPGNGRTGRTPTWGPARPGGGVGQPAGGAGGCGASGPAPAPAGTGTGGIGAGTGTWPSVGIRIQSTG